MPGGDGSAGVHWLPVLTAGLGAMALLRSAIFTVRTGGQDVAVGGEGELAFGHVRS